MKNLNVSYVGAELTPSASPSTNGGGWKKGCDKHVVSGDTTVMTQTGTSSASPLYTDTRRPYYSGGISTGNHYFGYVTSTSGGSGENGTVSAVITPRGQFESYLKYGYGLVRTIRHFVYLDQLMLDSVSGTLSTMTSAVAVGSCLNKEAVLNLIDFLALCTEYGCRVFPVLLNIDSSSPHGMYGACLTNFDVPGSQTANQAAASQTYLNAIQEVLAALDQYPEAHAAIAGIDLHNECIGQITNAGGLNLPLSTAQAWMRALAYYAQQGSKTFLYTCSAQSGLSDTTTNLLAATASNARAAASNYAPFGFIDQHIYANVQGGNTALTNGLANIANLGVPWICGEAADNGSSSGVSVFDGNAPIQQQSTDWLLKNLGTYGCQAVVTPSFANLTTFVSSSGNVQSYTDSGMTNLFRYYAGLHVV